MKPKILLTNDDGINSVGIWAAYQALSEIADVTVIAPSSQQSAVGRSLSIFEPIRATSVRINGVNAYSIGGKPTDSVIIGLYGLEIAPDLVVSGINIGENLSFESVMTSGTIGAALEASNQGVPAIAFSLQVDDQGEKFDDPRFCAQNFESSEIIVRDICSRILKEGFPEATDVINVNIPEHFTGNYEITHLARKLFKTGVERRHDPRGRPYYWINGPLCENAPEGTDVYAVNQGNVSITPLTLDSTAYNEKENLSTIFCRKEN